MPSVKNLVSWVALVTVIIIGLIQMGLDLLRYIPFMNVLLGSGSILLEIVQIFAAITLATVGMQEYRWGGHN